MRRVRKGAGMVKTTLYVDETLWHQAKIRAAVERKNLTEILAAALAAYLKQPPKKEPK
jgi:hypothetical protein